MLPAPRDPRYSPFASLGISAWRPRATRTLDGRRVLSGGWLNAPVPPLCTRVPRCEATGAVSMAPRMTADGCASHEDRYRGERPFLDPSWLRVESARIFGAVLCPELTDGGLHFEDAVEPYEPRDHAGPLGVPRGWCRGLNGDVAEAR